ncbi:NAD(P)-binding domain-containing protein [Mesonia sp. MT50]|uniref:NAD(P)-binding domain-containing protein n=1 Tax=Mesonia profundi TaxID=3070998 RepID=A0ABU0ZXI3_9FLAO|nr:NAD(P)-binding domain-containing protein [Mesonia profundi]MDQ7916175.1 NAD(P)-binding domain-containing protein [Mesonia profundi]
MKNKIAILGCGWLGFPLAQKLVKEGYDVKGTTTTSGKLEKLEEAGIQSFLISLTEEKVTGNTKDFLSNIETLIIDIPPGLRRNPNEDFVKKMKNFLTEVEKSDVKNVVYVSSTSVFEGDDTIPVFSESDKPNGSSFKAQQLIAVEGLWQNHAAFLSAVVRFGGLVGEDRHPAKYLAGKKNVKNPQAPVNMIAQKDAVELLLQWVKNPVAGIFHGVYPDHPSREVYYSAKAKEKGLATPHFNTKETSKGKQISSKETSKTLDFVFQHRP